MRTKSWLKRVKGGIKNPSARVVAVRSYTKRGVLEPVFETRTPLSDYELEKLGANMGIPLTQTTDGARNLVLFETPAHANPRQIDALARALALKKMGPKPPIRKIPVQFVELVAKTKVITGFAAVPHPDLAPMGLYLLGLKTTGGLNPELKEALRQELGTNVLFHPQSKTHVATNTAVELKEVQRVQLLLETIRKAFGN